MGWESGQPSWASGDRDGAEVRDRRSGRHLVRYVGEDIDIRGEGDRLVITDGEREYVVAA